MTTITIKSRNEVAARCKCGKPLMNRAGQALKLLGRDTEILQRDGVLYLCGCCGTCGLRYKKPLDELVKKEEA